MVRAGPRVTMARSSTDLPRMQNQSRARAPLERSLSIVSQVLEKTAKPKAVKAADDAAIRPDRAREALQSRHQRGAAQPRLRLRHEGAWRAEARVRRPVFLPSAGSRCDPDRSQARRRHHRRRAPARHHRGYRRHPGRDRPDVRPGHRRAGRRPHQAQDGSTSSPRRPSRPRTCASSCWPSPTTCGCCWSSSPTACTTCARCPTCRPRRVGAAPRKRSTSTLRSPAAWACTRCARSSRIWRSASSIPKPTRSSASALTRSKRKTSAW